MHIPELIIFKVLFGENYKCSQPKDKDHTYAMQYTYIYAYTCSYKYKVSL